MKRIKEAINHKDSSYKVIKLGGSGVVLCSS